MIIHVSVKINEECDKALAAKAKDEEEKAKAAQQLEQAKQLSESDQKQRTATEGKSGSLKNLLSKTNNYFQYAVYSK